MERWKSLKVAKLAKLAKLAKKSKSGKGGESGREKVLFTASTTTILNGFMNNNTRTLATALSTP